MNTNPTDKTPAPAEEMRAAAKTLRCYHSFPCAPPHGSLARPGDCNKCGTAYGPQSVVDELAEPLAKWLDKVANGVDGVNPAEGCYCIYEDSYHRAIEVAHVINGTTDDNPFEDAR